MMLMNHEIRIGFIGVGRMGQHIVRNLSNHYLSICVYSKHQKNIPKDIQIRCDVVNDIRKCVNNSDVIFTMLKHEDDVFEVYYGKNGILDVTNDSKCFIDLTSSTPNLAVKIYNSAKKISCASLDCPVSGGINGAREGSLSAFIGGTIEDYDRYHEIISAFSNKMVYFGEAGRGQYAKLANQIMLAGIKAGICESFAFALEHNIDLEKLMSAMENGAGTNKQLEIIGKKIIERNNSPSFTVDLFVKDLRNALDTHDNSKFEMPITDIVMNAYQDIQARGSGKYGSQLLMEYYLKKFFS